MKSFRILAIAASVLVFIGPAAAVEVDFSKLTCKQAAEMGPVATGLFAAWASGYAAGKSGDTMGESGQLTANADKVQAACAATPDATIESVISGLK